MKKILCFFVFLISVFLSWDTLAAGTSSATALANVNNSLTIAVGETTSKLQIIALKWLSGFILIQFIFTNLALIFSDFEAIWKKFLASLLWFGMCFTIMTDAPQFLSRVINEILEKAGGLAGGGNAFDAAGIIDNGSIIGNNLIQAITDASGFVSFVPALILAGLLAIFVLFVCGIIAFKIFLIKVELMLIVMMAPLSFSFLGLNIMRDQGIAPFKAIIALMYRILLLGVIMSAMNSVGANLSGVIASIDKTSFVNGMWQSLFGAIIAFGLLGYLAIKSDALAANLSSGGTSLSTSDSSAAAAMGGAMGAAVGGAIGSALTGGASLAARAKTMGEVISNLAGAGGASNVGGGVGGNKMPSGDAPVRPSASLAEKGVMPSRPKEDSPSSAAPQKSNSSAPNKQESNLANTNTSQSTSGSGSTAGIGGGGSEMEKKIDSLLAAQNNKPPGLKDHLSDLNRHVQSDHGVTHVSINMGGTE